MGENKTALKAALYMLYAFLAALLIFAVALPFGVTWYVEMRGRDQTLPATIMITCYPCVPFAAFALLSLRRVIKNAVEGNVLCAKNTALLRGVAVSCFAITAITLAAGRLYKPFFIIAACSAACGITFFAVKCLIAAVSEAVKADKKEETGEESEVSV